MVEVVKVGVMGCDGNGSCSGGGGCRWGGA